MALLTLGQALSNSSLIKKMHHGLAYRQVDEGMFLTKGDFCKMTLACVKLTKNSNNQHSHEDNRLPALQQQSRDYKLNFGIVS